MHYKRRENLGWRKLDNYAKLFPLASTKEYMTVFRLSVILSDKINKEILEKSVKIALNKFKFFKVRMRKGIFWHYFEVNNKNFIIEEEKDYPCKCINLAGNNDYLFKITYYDKKINLDVYHCLTDGNGAIDFLKEITYNYIEIRYLNNITTSRLKERKIKYTAEDSYIKNYDKKIKAKRDSKKAYNLKGETLSKGIISVTHEYMNSSKLREIAKKYNASVTQFLTTCLIYAIHEVGIKPDKSKKEIIIQVPVNLKKYFSSYTSSNFFSYIDVNVDTNKNSNFENILKIVKSQFQEKLKQEELLKTIAINLKLSNNYFLRIVPLFLKKIVVEKVHKKYRKYNTTTLSNIGRIGMLQEYKPYIDSFLFLIAPEKIEKIKCTVCAFEENMVFSFASVLATKYVEHKFKEILESFGINVRLEGNEI